MALVSVLSAIWINLSIDYSQPVCGSASGGPTENPITRHYDDYTWTNTIKWSCVYNITDFEGHSDEERFNKARDAAFENGGGVVYLPSDTYTFTNDLMLKAGVVLRGDPPQEPNAVSESYNPKTQLVFPAYKATFSGNGAPNNTAFKVIWSNDVDSTLGLIHLDINRAGIEIGHDINAARNRNIIIYGVRSNNVARPVSVVPSSLQSSWLRYPDVYVANIKIIAYANVLVANNRLNDAPTDNFEQPNYQIQGDDGQIITLKEGWKVPFNYTNHYGISINRLKNNNVFFKLLADPQKEPGLFRQGIVIRDNWVYHTMRVGIHASGEGLIIQDNVIRDQPEKRWYTDKIGLGVPHLNNPNKNPPNITYENRAIDWSGWHVTVKGNNYEVYRHYLGDSQDKSVDGEGILIQECCGGTKIQGAEIVGNRGNSYIGIYKVPNIQNVTITDNQLLANVTDTPLIYVSADTNRQAHRMNHVRIENNVINGNILAKASEGGRGNVIRNNRGQSGSELKISCSIETENNLEFQLKPCYALDDK